MATEAKRGFIRISTNYIRIFSASILGLIWVPFMLNWVGTAGYGLIGFVIAMSGFAGLMAPSTYQSMVREIGASYHAGDPTEFKRRYNSAFLVAGGAVLVSLISFTVLFFLLPVFKTSAAGAQTGQWLVAARSFLVSLACFAVLSISTAPINCMLIVQERFVFHNATMVAKRSAALAAALLLAFGFGIRNPDTALFWYPIAWCSLRGLVELTTSIIIVSGNRLLVPAPSMISFAAVKEVLHTFSWNSAVQIAMGLYERLSMAIMNLAFGLVGNTLFDLGYRLASYVRMATVGNTSGLDGVSARIQSEGNPRKMRALVQHSTRLHGLVALPLGTSVFLLVDPLLTLWIGRHTNSPGIVSDAGLMVRILSFAIVSRCIADSWTHILYGAGHIRRYAPMVLLGGIVGPGLGGLLIFLMPSPFDVFAPAIGFSFIFTIVHFIIVPTIGARCLDMKLRDFHAPLLRPLMVTALTAPVLIVAILFIRTWTLIDLFIIGALYGVIYAGLAWGIVLRSEERSRFMGAAMRRIPFRSTPDDMSLPD